MILLLEDFWLMLLVLPNLYQGTLEMDKVIHVQIISMQADAINISCIQPHQFCTLVSIKYKLISWQTNFLEVFSWHWLQEIQFLVRQFTMRLNLKSEIGVKF